MSKCTLKRKCRITGNVSEIEVEGKRFGPFLVHRSPEMDLRGLWTVTHCRTGFAVQRGLPTEWRAKWLARKLRELKVWDFAEPSAVKQLPAEVLAQITVLRADAMSGDCQGEAAA